MRWPALCRDCGQPPEIVLLVKNSVGDGAESAPDRGEPLEGGAVTSTPKQ
jgi:hypothetical protein